VSECPGRCTELGSPVAQPREDARHAGSRQLFPKPEQPSYEPGCQAPPVDARSRPRCDLICVYLCDLWPPLRWLLASASLR